MKPHKSLFIDSKLISSVTGAVFASVKKVLSAGGSAVSGVFEESETKRMRDTAQATIKSIHDEIRQEYDLSGFQKKLDEYVTKLEPQKSRC